MSSIEQGALTGQGTLAQLLAEVAPKRTRTITPPRSAGGVTPGTGPTRSRRAPKLFFLSELELRGDVGAAARVAGCSPTAVREWRRNDPKFARDYLMAIAAHLKNLRDMINEVAVLHPSTEIRRQARDLLQSERHYIGEDGRLDGRAWRDALREFGRSIRLDLARWEPFSVAYAAQESEPGFANACWPRSISQPDLPAANAPYPG